MEHPLTAYICGEGVFSLCRNYEIMLGDKSIGAAEVSIEGLYYRFSCRCKLSGEIMYCLKTVCAERECDLGVLVPIGDVFGIDTRRPVKKVGEGILSFYAVPRHPEITGQFVPIRADEPFMYLEKLQKAHLDVQREVVGVVIEETEEIN